MILTRLFRPAPRPAVERPTRRLTVEALEDRSTPSTGGTLDPTFGAGGVVTTNPVNGGRIETGGGASAVQPDGKVVVVGSSLQETSLKVGYVDVVRYNPNGTLDTSFNGSGVAVTKYGRRVSANGVAIDPATGKIYVAGGGGGSFRVNRYNSNGTVDTAFNGGKGDVYVSFPGYAVAQISGMTLGTVGGVRKLVVYGCVDGPTGGFALARLNLDGTLDPAFGAGGRVTTYLSPVTGESDIIRSAVVQPDGKVVVTGFVTYPVTLSNGNAFTQTEAVVARYTTSGTLDPAFGSDPDTGAAGGGYAALRVGPSGEGRSVALQPDGKIVVGGTAQPNPLAYSDSLLARFNPDGSLDATFAGGGFFTTDLDDPGSNDNINVVAVQADGSVVAGAVTMLNGSFLLRFHPNGSPDATFGAGGRAALSLSPPWGTGLVLQSDGKIVATGSANNRIGAARYLPSAPQVGSFVAAPNPATADSPVILTAGNIADGNPGATVTRVTFSVLNADGSETALGTGTRNADGTWSLTFSTAGWAAGSYTLLARATDSLGAVGDPLSLALTI